MIYTNFCHISPLLPLWFSPSHNSPGVHCHVLLVSLPSFPKPCFNNFKLQLWIWPYIRFQDLILCVRGAAGGREWIAKHQPILGSPTKCQNNSTQFWWYVNKHSIRYHRLRVQSTRLPLTFRMPVTNPGCHSIFDLLAVKQRFPRTPPRVQLIC